MALGTTLGLAASIGIFAAMRYMSASCRLAAILTHAAPAAPKTMTPEYKEQERERMIATNQNPITGITAKAREHGEAHSI